MPINNYLNQIISIKSKTGFNAYGKPTVGTASNIQCRIVEKTSLLTDENGKEYQSDIQLWVLPTQALTLEDLVTYNSITYRIAKIDHERGLSGSIDHKKAYLVKAKNV